MAPPTMCPLIDLTSDNEDESNIIDFTYSPPRHSLNDALIQEQIPPEAPLQARKVFSIHSKSSPTQFSLDGRSVHRRATFGNSALLPPATFSAPSTHQTRNGTKNNLRGQFGGSQSIFPTRGLIVEDSKEEDDIVPLNRGATMEDGEGADDQEEAGVGDCDIRSMRSSRGDLNSQKSLDRSVGTDSPLLVHHRKKRSRNKTENSRSQRNESPREVMARRSMSMDQQSRVKQIDIDQLEEDLEQFRQKMHDDYAETVKWLLHDAKRASDKTRPAFMDEISPFASMTPLNALSGPAADGMDKLKLDTYVNKKKLVKSSTYSLKTKVASNVPRVPKYSSLTMVKRNILCADDEQLKFMPYLTDSNKASVFNRLVKELEEAYSAKRSGSDSDTELASQLGTYLDGWLEEVNLGLDRQVLVRYILHEDSDSLGKSQKEIRLLRKAFGVQLPSTLAGAATTFSAAFKTVFAVSIAAVILPDDRLNEMLEANKSRLDGSQGRSQSDSPKSQSSAEHKDDRLGTYTHQTCLICGVISCQTHGDYRRDEVCNDDDSEMSDLGEVPAEEYTYNHQPVNLHYHEILRKQNARLSKDLPSTDPANLASVRKSCSGECYRTFDYHGKTSELDLESLVALKSFMVSMRPENDQACDIAFLLDLPCWQVHTKIQEMKQIIPCIPPEPFLHGRSKGIGWYDKKKKTLRSDWRELTEAHLHQERTQANACSHDGPCTGDCPCALSNILCETFCGCPDDCQRRFTGCTCHASGRPCVSPESCICIAMNRECGPQCSSCGAIPRIDPRNKYDDDLFARGCQNIVLQRGVNRKLMIGESQLDGVGFGLYLGEPVHKGDYLGEYGGEVISSQEAERRGIIYDRKYLSFLFDLNRDWVIDAARLGNKTRFINHAESENNGLNCEAKVMLVNGEHRIKFFALRDIQVGEELLFNYGKKFAEKQGLSKILPKAAKDGSKKGVIVGEEALEALDGNRARGKWTATRGGHSSGRGGRKAVKSAPMKPMRELVVEMEKAVEEDEKALDVDPVDEDEDDEEDVYRRRAKRQIRRPKRYTR